MLTFADELKQSLIETWQQILNHRFIIEIYNNTLPIDKFIFYLKQDQLFLKEFCRSLNVAKQKSNNHADLVKLFDNLLYSTVNFEMKMQDQIIADSLNLSTSSSSSSSRSNHVISSYHMLFTLGKYPRMVLDEIVSVILPCPEMKLLQDGKIGEFNKLRSKQDVPNHLQKQILLEKILKE